MTTNLDDKREPGHASESTRLSPTAPSQMSNRTKIAIAAAGALVLVAGGVLIGGQLGGEEDPAAQATPTAEAPVTPGTQETAEPQPTTPAEVIAAIDATKVPENILELGTYSLLSPEAQAKMQSLNEMDATTTFRDQPYEDQVAFCMQILDNIRPRVDYALSENNISLHYTDNPTTAQQIQDNSTYIEIAATNFLTKGEDGSYAFDNQLALKFASIIQDVRVTVEGRIDETYGQITVATLPSYSSMYEAWKATVSNESVAEDGTITYTETTEAGEIVTMQTKPVSYTSMLDGSAKQLYVVVGTQRQ